jgi:hypothetical protein
MKWPRRRVYVPATSSVLPKEERSLKRKPITASAAVMAVAALAMLPGSVDAAAKKSHTVRVVASGGKVTNGGTAQQDIKVAGSPFADCTIDVAYSPPTVTQKWTCKGGSFQGRYAATITGSRVTGTAKLSRGTGKYKGISGSLKVDGDLTTGVVKLTGSARY